MKKIRNIIMLISIIVFITVIVLCTLLINKNKQDINNSIINTSTNTEEKNNLKQTDNIQKMYSVEKIINYALDGAYDEIIDEENNQDTVANRFIDKFNISNGEYYIQKLYTINPNSKYSICFASGDIVYNKSEEAEQEDITKQTAMFTIVEDIESKEYAIEEYGENYKDIFNYESNLTDLTYEMSKIQNFEPSSESVFYEIYEDDTSDIDLVKWLYSKYKLYSLHFYEDAYNMIDNEYKQKRFNDDINNYVEYLKEYNPIIENNELSQYAKNEMNGYTLYTLVDNRDYSYFVKVPNDSVECKFLLDTYTITYDGYNEKYQNMSDSQKAAANMQKFINMLNTKDYSHAYEVLDNTFKNNNFSTLEEFKNYIKRNLYEKNEVINSEVRLYDNYYEGKIYIMNGDDNYSASKVLNIVMQLKEGTDFVMSFNIE